MTQMEKEAPLFIFKVDGQPVVGDLRRYAKVWEHAQYSGDVDLSSTLLTWEGRDPITHDVQIRNVGTTESDYILFEFSIAGFPGKVLVSIDGRASKGGAPAVTGTSDSFSSAYIGAYLREIREMKGCGREPVAKAAGVTATAVAAYETGKTRVTLQTFIRVCLFLGYDPLAVLADILKDNDVQPFEP